MENEKQVVARELRHFLGVFRAEVRLEDYRGLARLEEKLTAVGNIEHSRPR
jgi:hypothetical protein